MSSTQLYENESHNTTPALPISAEMDPHARICWKMEEGPFGELGPLLVHWAVEPDIKIITKIARRTLGIPADSPCEAEFLAQGGFNKVYTIHCGLNTIYLLRVTAPVQPQLKTLSECATIEYVRHHTDIPAPRVLPGHYDSTNDNELGFEWMIQECIQGEKLGDMWRHMLWLEKELLVRKIIVYMAQLFRQRFHRLGNLYATQDLQQLPTADFPDTCLLGAEHSSNSKGFCMSEVVSIPFFYNDHWTLDIERGPYKHSRDWLAAQLQIALHDADYLSDDEDSDDDDDDDEDWSDTSSPITILDTISFTTTASSSTIQDASLHPESRAAIKARIHRLQSLLPTHFPPTENKETYILHHQDLSANNILLNPTTHTLAGIIDWECVHTVLLYLGCQLPKFLLGRTRTSPPRFATDFENEWYEKAYYDDLEEYEKTRLREFFLEEMARVCPEWIACYEESGVKADFAFAVGVVSMRGHGDTIDEWVEAVEKGEEIWGLREELGMC